MKGTMVKYNIEVWGCQMSEHDAENIAGMLEEMGYEKASTSEDADLVVLHTCCVREKAESKVLTRIGILRKHKQDHPGFILAVGGCMTQQADVAKYIQHNFIDVDIIFGTHNIHRFPEMVADVKNKHCRVLEVWEEELPTTDTMPVVRQDPIKAYVNIIYGCNNFCSYCIVPYVRGRERSRSIECIEDEVRGLLNQGYQEIMLLGQNVNSYGKDLPGRPDFSDLLIALDKLGDYRLRYMTSHPRDFNNRLIETIKNSKNICPQFHLPIQSGSDHILKLMRRGYTQEKYKALIDNIYKNFARPVITTDIIVGYPGETEEDFEATLNMVAYAQFDLSYTFLYSPREGTPAAEVIEQVPDEVKTERFNRLVALQNSIALEKNQRLIGQTLDVLIEGTSRKNSKVLTGRSAGGKRVNLIGQEENIHTIQPVLITSVTTFSLNGEIKGDN